MYEQISNLKTTLEAAGRSQVTLQKRLSTAYSQCTALIHAGYPMSSGAEQLVRRIAVAVCPDAASHCALKACVTCGGKE
jgi:hypothetical protein